MRAVFDDSPVGMAIVGQDFRFLRVNAVLVQITGYSEADLLARTFVDITHPQDTEKDVALATRLLRGDIPRYQIEKRYIRCDGETIWVLLSVTLLRDRAGAPLHYLSTIQDISEAKHAEVRSRELARSLEESELRYRQTLDTITDLVFVKDRNSRLQWANRAFCDFFGLEPTQVQGLVDAEHNPSENTDGYLATDAVVVETGTTQAVEREPATRCDGANRVLNTVKSPLRDAGGRVTGLVGVARDVTDRVRLEAELTQATTRFQALIENALDVITVLDADGVQRFLSPSVKRVLGWSPEELIGRTALELIHPDDAPAVATLFASRAVEPGARDSIEFRHAHKDGSWRYLQAVGHNLLDDPAIGGVVVNSRDVTDRRLAEEKLARSEAYFRALVEQASDIITVLEPDGVVRYASPAVTRVLGYEPEELAGTQLFRLIHPDDLPALVSSFESALAGTLDESVKSAPERFRCRHKNGTWVALEGTGAIRVDDPLVRGVIGVSRDVSERARVEAERERLIGELHAALADVKALSGLLPICSSCKRIREDDGYWTQIEAYVREHSEAEFTHGLCPACAAELYPDIFPAPPAGGGRR